MTEFQRKHSKGHKDITLKDGCSYMSTLNLWQILLCVYAMQEWIDWGAAITLERWRGRSVCLFSRQFVKYFSFLPLEVEEMLQCTEIPLLPFGLEYSLCVFCHIAANLWWPPKWFSRLCLPLPRDPGLSWWSAIQIWTMAAQLSFQDRMKSG